MSAKAKTIDVIEQACRFIENSEHIPTLAQVADHVGMSASHFQRVFTETLGISPRNFADAKRQKTLRQQLAQGDDISGALYEAGYGSNSRVYEFANRYLGMTPGAYKQGGKEETIWYTTATCSLGILLVATTEKGICAAKVGDDAAQLQHELTQEFHAAELIESNTHHQAWVQLLIDYLDGAGPWPTLPYDVKATAFQRKVWDWLRTIPPGKTYHYSELAKALGEPKAARAVARACATNPVALVIPCHRIVPKSGGVGGYRWNPKRKKALLELETQQHDQ